jgi:hypothetical protein
VISLAIWWRKTIENLENKIALIQEAFNLVAKCILSVIPLRPYISSMRE